MNEAMCLNCGSTEMFPVGNSIYACSCGTFLMLIPVARVSNPTLMKIKESDIDREIERQFPTLMEEIEQRLAAEAEMDRYV